MLGPLPLAMEPAHVTSGVTGRNDIDSELARMSLLPLVPNDLEAPSWSLYEKARSTHQWTPRTDIDWDRPTTLGPELLRLSWRITARPYIRSKPVFSIIGQLPTDFLRSD